VGESDSQRGWTQNTAEVLSLTVAHGLRPTAHGRLVKIRLTRENPAEAGSHVPPVSRLPPQATAANGLRPTAYSPPPTAHGPRPTAHGLERHRALIRTSRARRARPSALPAHPKVLTKGRAIRMPSAVGS
jgi:hypothetical protein